MGEALRTKIFPRTMLGVVMTGNKHDMLSKFLKMKPLTCVGFETKHVFEMIVDCHERLPKMGIIEWYVVKVVAFHPQGDAM